MWGTTPYFGFIRASGSASENGSLDGSSILVSHEPKAVNPMNDTASRKVNDDIDGDTLHEECGVFGILGHSDAAALTALGLHALQHRGQEAAGIVTFDDKSKQFHTEKRM